MDTGGDCLTAITYFEIVSEYQQLLMTLINEDISIAHEYLKKGDIIAIPTETVYGLAGNAYNKDAILKIFSMKQRPHFDPLIVHTYSIEATSEFVKNIPKKALSLAEKFWPGPLTLLLQKKNIIPDIVTSGLETVGVRIPNHELTLSLLKKTKFPLAAPSANIFGYISPTEPKHIIKQFKEKLKFILDGGKCKKGIESTIIGNFNNNKPTVYRLGSISIDEIEKVIGKVTITLKGSNPKSPGMIDDHYSPRKPLYLGNLELLINKFQNNKLSIISFTEKPFKSPNIIKNFVLSQKASLEEAAGNLFSILHKADENEANIILAEECPDIGLGRSINDRLKRASVKNNP